MCDALRRRPPRDASRCSGFASVLLVVHVLDLPHLAFCFGLPSSLFARLLSEHSVEHGAAKRDWLSRAVVEPSGQSFTFMPEQISC